MRQNNAIFEGENKMRYARIEDQDINKLNRLKKVNTEAFFYCLQLEQLK